MTRSSEGSAASSDPASDGAALDGSPIPIAAVLPALQLWVRPEPRRRRIVCPPGVLPAAGIAGVAAAVLIPVNRPGVGWVLASAVAAGAVFEVDRRARKTVAAEPSAAKDPEGSEIPGAASGADAGGPTPTKAVRHPWDWGRVWWATVASALLAVGAFRAAGWLFTLCVAAALVAGSLAVVGKRSAKGVWYDVVAVPWESLSAVPWAYQGAVRMRGPATTRATRIGWSVLVTVALLAVFVPLLGSADATFGFLVGTLVPEVDAPALMRWSILFALAGAGSLGAMYLLAGPPAAADPGPRPGRTLRRSEWVLPVGALTALFGFFLVAQFVALFGGDDYVQRTAGLTYAEYARSGFWQLSIVSILTLAVIVAVLHWAARDSAADRTWLRALLGAVSLLSLVIVASALGRMWTYQQAYGFTVLRLLVEVFELWLGLIFLLVLAAIARLDLTWLPRAAIGTAFATLLALAVVNPERLIADRNIDRWQHGKDLDVEYLMTLSPDVLPALSRLSAPTRAPIDDYIRAGLPADSWQSWNLSRANAR
ncbi:DUF4173 domain-containing protein [Nocardia sp. NPDC050710]|uniref:DUF4153 domain-containing protein n=1 Tax=Nocardia sp. NPDC050710 TaxID=3157220 RepID=UPI0033D36EF3